MGQSYRGTEAVFLDDAMFKLPYELIGKVIEKKDKEVNDNLDLLTSYSDKLKADVLEEDSPQLRAKIQEVQQRIDNAVQNIQNDPLNYTNQLGEIKTLGRDITRDWSSTGYVGTMEANKKQYLAEKEKIDALVKAGKLDPTIATIEEAKIRERYKSQGGLKWNKDSQKPENGLDIQSQYYNLEFDEKFLQYMKPDEWSEEYDTASGMYIYTNKNSGKQLTREDIIEAYLTQLQADTPTLYAANRYAQLGGDKDLAGYEGVNRIGEAVYYETVKGKDGKERKVLRTNSENYWGRKAEAAAKVFEQKERNTSVTMKDNAFAQRQYEKQQEETEEIIIDTDTEIGLKNATASSAGTTWSINNSKLSNLKTEIAKLAAANGVKEGTKEYKAIMSGDPIAIKAMFADEKTAQDYITKFNDINMEINMQKASIESFNKTYSKELQGIGSLTADPSSWTPKQKEFYNTKMSEKKVVQVVKGDATYNNLNLNTATKKEHREAVEKGILDGTGTFTTTEGLPSLKYKGARVRYLNKQNKMYASDLDPSKKVTLTIDGKTYYSKTVNPENKYTVPVKGKDGKITYKSVTVDPKDILITEASNGPVNLSYYAQQGHLQYTEVISEEEETEDGETKTTSMMGYKTMEGGKMVNISVDKANTAPSWLLDNQKENYTRSALKIGSQAVEIEVKGVTTKSLEQAWSNTYELRNMETTKVKYGSDFSTSEPIPGPGNITYRVVNGKYYRDTPTQKGQLITDKDTIYEIDQAIFYKRNY